MASETNHLLRMKKRIEDMIHCLRIEEYDPYRTHVAYDELLEDFIRHTPNEEEISLMRELIELEKNFWYC